MSIQRQYFPVLFRWTTNYRIVAVLPYQRAAPGVLTTFTPEHQFVDIPWEQFSAMRVADQCDETDALLAGLRIVYEPAGHKSAYEVRSRGQLPWDWRKKAWGELPEELQHLAGARARPPKASAWSRSYILEVLRMMRLLRPMMTEQPFNAYINMWADTIALGNPLFQRERFLADCWKREEE